ncbi:hypothetical protein EMIHUDRAFT_206969 [Emiliania huxleyi CCMP1516]|uniref:Uncharacterized protein n=2 Tax=Emiliania huxleyi TaxID=2903 RepID=A0A0D3JKD0_EMIH1|nr:hypothetical protein EMIHUDRAFT_206969 [Emiliania huxleyi CCMP1516]EOD23965.1 hypothetical protein EMIHUDRAFT_206969 [Emiliania huxleyi CCMP1516]|eukprot:XP_005776394.1 hypothetical protein EMIHUDRAFT_206969 [Emiliania huxleyi CCMP1516]
MLRHFVGQSHPSAGGEASKEHVDDDAKEDHVDEAELLLALLQRCGPALTRRQASDFVRRSKERAEDREHGIVVVGNGRSILGGGAGAAVDAFRHVLRFNDYEVDGFARDVGSRTSLCVELLRKYPHRWAAEEDGGEGLPVLVAIPYLFLGEQHYQRRRAEVTEELAAEMPAALAAVSFLPEESARSHVTLLGFDHFREIGGRIHYFDDAHTANHDAACEERICLALAQQGFVRFLL